MDDSLDLFNRDPNDINAHLQCAFEDVLAEPEGARSIICVWKLSHLCFNCSKAVYYKLATLCCGICIAYYWGSEFASIAFWHIWFYTPMFRTWTITCGCLKKIYSMCCRCFMDPCCESCGLMFSAFKKS